MGGGELTREFLREDLVDGIQVAVVPVVLGGGVPLFAPRFAERQFQFSGQRVYRNSGIVMLEYVRRAV